MSIDKDAIYEAYQDVRSDGTDTTWAAFHFDDDNVIRVLQKGSDYSDFLALCQDQDRLFGYARFETGDEMSKRAKFALITYIGPSISVMKKAKMSTDKSLVKQICSTYGCEVLSETVDDLEPSKVVERLRKAGGADYGVGTR